MNPEIASRIGALVVAAALLVPQLLFADKTWSQNSAANRLFKEGKYQEALELYEKALVENPAEERLKMNKGSALLHLGQVDEAEKEYARIGAVPSVAAEADRQYNHGTILFIKGEQALQQGGQGAMEHYTAALEAFKRSLDNRPGDTDARWNLELTQARIKQLKEQEQNQDQCNQQDKNDKNKQDQDKQGQNQQDQQKDSQNKQESGEDSQNKDQSQGEDGKEQDGDKDDKSPEQQQQQNAGDKDKEKQPASQQQAGQVDPNEQEKAQAARLIEQFSDDAKDLNRPVQMKPLKGRQIEKDW